MSKPSVGLTSSVDSPSTFLRMVDLPELSRPRKRMRSSRSLTVEASEQECVRVSCESAASDLAGLYSRLLARMMERRPMLEGEKWT